MVPRLRAMRRRCWRQIPMFVAASSFTDVAHQRRSSKSLTPIPPTMKLSWGFVASSLYCTVSAARPSVSPETARLIIAQRLGLSRFHSVEHADAETLRHINTYGGRQQKLFGGDDADRSKAHLLVWVEDAEQDEATGWDAL
jgi:hypothetical protein